MNMHIELTNNKLLYSWICSRLISKNIVQMAVGAISMKSVIKIAFLYASQNDIGKTKLKYIKIKLILATIVVSINSNRLTPFFIPIVKQPTITLIKRIIIATIYSCIHNLFSRYW